jgi:hypothetical protein
MAGQRIRRNQRKLGGQCNVQNIPDSPDISLNDVSFTSMTVHMETVYAADKNVTSFDFLGTPDGAMDSSDASMSTSRTGRSYNNILSMAGRKFR